MQYFLKTIDGPHIYNYINKYKPILDVDKLQYNCSSNNNTSPNYQ